MIRRTQYALILVCAICSSVFAQVEARKPTPGIDIPEFFMDALAFASGDSTHSRLDVYVHVPYDVLRFVANNAGYKAQYDVTVNIASDENEGVAEKTWTEDVRHQSYEETEKRDAYSLTQRSFTLLPGTYIIRVQVHDTESKKNAMVVKKITVDNYALPTLAMSDVMLISRVTSDNGRLNIVPNISGNVADVVNGLYVFYEIYNGDGADSVSALYEISNGKRENVFMQRVLHKLSGKKTQIIEKLDTAQFSSGTYYLTIETKQIKPAVADDPPSALKKKSFVARWGNMPFSITDLDLAIRQLRYIAKDKEYKDMTEASTNEEKMKLFQEFWQRRDPSPDTKRNEYMEEYYSRVEYANQHFSHYLAGWRTDMGMVFILLGSPNNVERHPFDIDSKPYEVWSYYDYNRQVVFADETGFGDYRLLTPIYDLLQRAR
jgi:GWxTD domain-containing protein